MCGFIGVYDKNNNYNLSLDKNLQKILHRGPDSQKILEIDKEIKLGFVRLGIIDLTEDGEQPMLSQEKDIIIVFNGELYNYKELKKELENKNHEFISNSDTEVFLHMYMEYGLNMLDRLEGMYAAVIVDKNKEELYLIRDRFGIKPMYYSNKNEMISFASEIKALLDLPNITKDISKDAIAEYLQYEYIQAPNTIFKDIKKLLPGHYIKISKGKLKEYEYWDCNQINEQNMTIEEAKEQVISKLKESLKFHLRSDVPIGIFLSGGIDSGLLVALASEEIKNIDTYTLKFEDGEFDESSLAQKVANKYMTNHHCYRVSPQDMSKLLPEMIWFCDEPLGDSGILPNYIINSFAAKDGIKVVLSGAGGDELFAGYNYYFGSNKEKFIMKFGFIFKIIAKLLKKIKPNIAEKIEIALLGISNPEKHMIRSKEIFNPKEIVAIMKNEIKILEKKEIYYSKYKNKGLNSLLYVDLKTYLPDDLMLLSDRTTMAHSIEGRVPYLYKPLVEYAFSIPEEIKTPKKQRKWLLKEIAKKYLPKEIIDAPKRGFCSPILKWSSNDFGEYAFRILNSNRSILREFWDRDNYKKFVSNKENYKNNFSRIYLLLVLEVFFRVHIDNNYNSKDDIDLEKIYEE